MLWSAVSPATFQQTLEACVTADKCTTAALHHQTETTTCWRNFQKAVLNIASRTFFYVIMIDDMWNVGEICPPPLFRHCYSMTVKTFQLMKAIMLLHLGLFFSTSLCCRPVKNRLKECLVFLECWGLPPHCHCCSVYAYGGSTCSRQ